MRSRLIRIAAVIVGALAGADTLEAHHSISMFDIATPVWVKGTVTGYRPINPHAMIDLEVTNDAGEVVEQWTIEGPFPGRLNRILELSGMREGDAFFRPGDAIEVCGFPPKAPSDAMARHFMHGHLIVMPDGHLQAWGPYGQINNCFRPGDEAGIWADFFNSDPVAHEYWCGSRERVKIASVAPEAFIDAINRLLSSPCR